MELFFYLFSSFLIASSIGVVNCKNQVNAAICLIFAFCNAASLFLLVGAEYVAMILVIVYVGAVAILFLFVIMLVKQNIAKKLDRNVFVESIIAVSFFTNLIFILVNYFCKNENKDKFSSTLDSIQNSQDHMQIASVLYTDFVLAFQACGLILMVAMVGCILLTLRKDTISKKQSTVSQLSRNKDNSIVISKVETKVGIDV